MKTKKFIIGGLVGILLLSPISGYCSSFFNISIGSDGVSITTSIDTPNYYPVPNNPEPNRKPEPPKPEPKKGHKKDNKKDNKKPNDNKKPGNNTPGNNKPTNSGNNTHTPTGKK
ncbi:MAG: hypothetical protein LIP09_06845 [Bacteroidales bacterium]|nr:hypothetical protein [Bacteroidales bacterium]